jgi:O-antigen ligase
MTTTTTTPTTTPTTTTTTTPIVTAPPVASGHRPPAVLSPRARRSLRWERIALVATAAAVALLPVLRPSGPGNTAPVDLLIVVAIAASARAAVVARRPYRLPFVIPVGLLVFAGAVAALLHERTTAALIALAQDVLLLLWAAAVANTLRTPARIATVLRVWCLAAVVAAALTVVGAILGLDAVAGITARTGSRAAFTFGDANLAGGWFVMSILVVLAVQYPRRRLLRWCAYALLASAVLATGSLGAIVSLSVALLLVGLWRLARRVGAPHAIAILCLVVPIAVLGVAAGYRALVVDSQGHSAFLHDSIGRTGTSVGTRDTLFAENTALLGHTSLLGEGPGATKRLLAAEQAPYVKEAHNDTLATAIERGVLGVLGLIVLVGTVAWYARRAMFSARRPAVAVALPVPEALVGALVAMAIASAFYEVLHFRHVWALFGVVAAMALLEKP